MPSYTCVFEVSVRARRAVMDGWMDDLRFYVLFNSVSVISGWWEVDNERLCAMEKKGFELRVFFRQRCAFTEELYSILNLACNICPIFVPTCTTIHRYQIFSTGYSVMCKVYTGYHGTEIEHGLCACTVDNPLAKARDYLSVQTHKPCSICHISWW